VVRGGRKKTGLKITKEPAQPAEKRAIRGGGLKREAPKSRQGWAGNRKKREIGWRCAKEKETTSEPTWRTSRLKNLLKEKAGGRERKVPIRSRLQAP